MTFGVKIVPPEGLKYKGWTIELCKQRRSWHAQASKPTGEGGLQIIGGSTFPSRRMAVTISKAWIRSQKRTGKYMTALNAPFWSNTRGAGKEAWRRIQAESLPPLRWGCNRCGDQEAGSHCTQREDDSGGMCPLCENCWRELTPETRLPYYRALWLLWEAEGDADSECIGYGSHSHGEDTGHYRASWSEIESAVMAGL